ncbi:hypothetical protein RJT34_11247 [Clitoria ternatea]|uniref:PGG domain-containing protein n=1 Tax=Clitoria ternatea TaxID=43366 RepID=A0AAN9JMD4_CLITE
MQCNNTIYLQKALLPSELVFNTMWKELEDVKEYFNPGYGFDLEPGWENEQTVQHEGNEFGDMYSLAKGGTRSNRWAEYPTERLKETTSPVGNTVLHLAAWYGNDELVGVIVEKHPELLFSRNYRWETPLHVVARGGHISTVRKLLHIYAYRKRVDEKINMDEFLELIKLGNNRRNNMLHEAIMSGERNIAIEIFQYLEDQYNTPNNEGGSLSPSCYNDLALHSTNKAHESVMCLAVQAGHKETVQLILNKCHLPTTPKGLSPLVAAIKKQDQDMLKIILEKDQWIHLVDDHGRIPLHYAALWGYREGVVLLLGKCKTCNSKRDKYGYFPIHLASQRGHVEVVKKLLDHCPNPKEMIDSHGRNILHIAAEYGKHEVVSYILNMEPGIISRFWCCSIPKEENGKTPWDEMINEKDHSGNTPLHRAARGCHPRVVYALTWDKRVDLDAVNLNGETPLDVANALYESKNGDLHVTLPERLPWAALTSAGANESSEFLLRDKGNKFSNIMKPGTKISDTELYSIAKTLTVPSTLILTASVAACLAVPGEAEGKANNLDNPMFHFFIFCITISLFSSIISTIILLSARLGLLHLLALALNFLMPIHDEKKKTILINWNFLCVKGE